MRRESTIAAALNEAKDLYWSTPWYRFLRRAYFKGVVWSFEFVFNERNMYGEEK